MRKESKKDAPKGTDPALLNEKNDFFTGTDGKPAEAHHIVQKGREGWEGAADSRAMLKHYEIDINNPDNGVFLSKKAHGKVHTKEYTADVYRRLRQAEKSAKSFDDARRRIQMELRSIAHEMRAKDDWRPRKQ